MNQAIFQLGDQNQPPEKQADLYYQDYLPPAP
jgi:hypothetical protein